LETKLKGRGKSIGQFDGKDKLPYAPLSLHRGLYAKGVRRNLSLPSAAPGRELYIK
jgi:hypothetical protein